MHLLSSPEPGVDDYHRLKKHILIVDEINSAAFCFLPIHLPFAHSVQNEVDEALDEQREHYRIDYLFPKIISVLR